MNKIPNSILLSGVLASTAALPAEAADGQSKWRVGVGYQGMFNVSARLRNTGAAAAANNPSVTGRSYTDGFVGTDDTGNALDLTTFWGYQNASQYAGDSIALRNSQRGHLAKDDNVWMHGFKMTVARELGGGGSFHWGIEGAFGYSRADIDWRSRATAGILSLDAFPLAGVMPPGTPYSGPQIAGPGAPLLGVIPTTIPLTVSAKMDAVIYGFQAGPYIEVPLGERWALAFGAGLSVAVVDSELTYRELAPAPFGGVGRSSKGNKTEAIVGGYLSGQVNLKLGESWDLFTGIQFHTLDDFRQTVGDKAAQLDLSTALDLLCGVQYHF